MSTTLSKWHARLDEHFRALRTERDRFGPDHPLFALEHGLDLDEDLPALGDAVKESVASGSLPRASWLPFVVYAAEVGYRYQGDKYWPRFEAGMPQWKRQGNAGRTYIRKTYEKFAETYRGAEPSGPWAAQFRNIAWPITHAVLPADLQRHLARLLYDYRHALTYALIGDHHSLGDRLARRSHYTSSRFKKFAENSQLLGLVATSLLLDDDDKSTLILRSTLDRVVTDLSDERQAGAWLRDAKKAAIRVRCRGFVPSSTSPHPIPAPSESDDLRWPGLELALSVRRSRGGWRAYVTVPSHESLARRFPDLRDVLERVRYRIRGVGGMQARGALMYRRGPIAFTDWPPSYESVVSAEGGSDALSQLLVDSCRLPGGPWLFRLREPGLASEVRTKQVRPGEQYILLKRVQSPKSGLDPVPMETKGVAAFCLKVPTKVDSVFIDDLREIGLGVVSDVHVWPAGLVAASWDGEGRVSWQAGEDPVIGVHSSRAATHCAVATESDIGEFSWPEDSDQLFVQLSGLDVGSHRVDVSLLDRGVERPIAEGQLHVRVLEPVDSSWNSSARQGLQVFSHPARPTLEELWTGGAAIVADGPAGERVHFTVELMTRGGCKTLPKISFSAALPVEQDRWQELFRGAKGAAEFSAAYDDAEELVITVSSSVLGSTQIRAQRPFAPLRWCAGRDRDGPFARLIDYMDSDDLVIEYYDAPHPARALPLTLDDEEYVRTSHGGLILAKTPELNASLILPPHISGGPLESLSRLNVRPSLPSGSRSAVFVKKMIQISHLWTHAAIPADNHAEMLQVRVNEAVVAHLGGMIGGDRWRDIEFDRIDGRRPGEQRLLDSIGRRSVDRRAAVALLERSRMIGPEPADRAAAFGSVIHRCTSEWKESLADPVLRLATVPGRLSADDPVTQDAVDMVLERPIVYRLARLFVFTFAPEEGESVSEPPLRSWPWD